MEGALEKFNLCCLFCNIKLKIKNRYVKGLWRFLTSQDNAIMFKNRSIVEKDFLVALAQTPDCLDTDMFPLQVRVFAKEIVDILKSNENKYRLECYVQSASFKHTVIYKKVPVSNTLGGEIISEDVDMSMPDTNKKTPWCSISNNELKEYKAAFLSHISRVTNKDDSIQENIETMAESNANNENSDHSADDAAVMSNDDMWQDYDMTAEESTPNNDISREHNDGDAGVVSSDDMWQDYMSDNAEESIPNNDRVEYMSDDNDLELVSNIGGNAAQMSTENNDGLSERKSIQRREAQEFFSVVINIPCDDLSKLFYTIRRFFKKSKLQEYFSRLTPIQQTFLMTVVDKPHLLVTGEGLPKSLKEAGRDIIALLKLNRKAYRWECLSFQDNVVYKKVPLPGRKIADVPSSSSLPENSIFDAKIAKLPMSGDCVILDPLRILEPWLGYEWPIFSALLKKVNDDNRILSYLTRLKNFLISDDNEFTIRTKSYPLTELIFKISARPPYLDTELFNTACRAVGVVILDLLQEISAEYNVACLIKGPHLSETITFKKMCSNQARKLRKVKQIAQQAKKAQLRKEQRVGVVMIGESRSGVRRRLAILTRIVTFLLKDWCKMVQFSSNLDEAEFLVMIACEPWMRRSAFMDDIPEAYSILVDAVDECVGKFDLIYAYPTLQIPRTVSASRPAPLPAPAYKEKLVEALNTPFVSPLTQRMMANMGWKGGALGKNGEGISTPIMPNLNQVKHAGLGYVNAKKGKKIEKPAPKDQQYHMMMRLLGVLNAFLDDASVDTAYVDVADLEYEEFAKSAANVLGFVNRREVMYNVGLEEESLFEEVVNQMTSDQNLVLRHSVETNTRINIIKVSLSEYKEEVRSQSKLNEETEITKPNEYKDALFKSLEAPLNTPEVNGKDEINNNNLLQLAKRNYEELFVFPQELSKVDDEVSIETPIENEGRSWYAEESNWNDQATLTDNDLVERLARDLLKCRQKLTDNSDSAVNDKNRVLGLVPVEEHNNVINEDVANFIQKNLLKELDKLPHKAEMKLKCFGIRNNMLIYQSLNEITYDWLVDVVKKINVKIFDFNIEDSNCRGLLVASNYAIENDEELLDRIKEFNENIDVGAWSVLNRFQVGNQMSYEIVVDRKSLLYIFNNNCSLNLGIDQAEFVFVGTL